MKYFAIAITLVFYAAHSYGEPVDESKCKALNGALFFGTSCFTINFNKATYDQQISACTAFDNGHLAHVTADRIEALRNHFSSYGYVGLKQTDLTNEPAGGWSWIDGNGKPVTESVGTIPWAPGEPNNAWNENCALNWGAGLADVYCQEQHQAMCQYDAPAGNSVDESKCKALDRALFLGRSCFVITSNKATFDEHAVGCTAYDNGHLAHSTAEIAVALSSFLAPFNAEIQDPYVGLKQAAGSAEPSGGWSWIDGNGKSVENAGNIPWVAGEPNNANAENCAHFWVDRKGINDLPCGISKYALCQYDAPS